MRTEIKELIEIEGKEKTLFLCEKKNGESFEESRGIKDMEAGIVY